MQLKSRAAIVTGSTSGIGLGIARAFAREGANVMLNGLAPALEAESLRMGIEAEFGVKCLFSAANMMNGAEVTGMVRGTESAFGSVDILVNNAGIQHVAPVEDFPDDKWEAIIRINLVAAFYAIKSALPGMKQRKWGRIVNISSAHGLVASPFKSAYVAAKHGISGLTKSIALETATDGITVNAIAPGYVWTPLVEKQIPDTMRARGLTKEQVINDVLLHAQPTRKFVTIEQVAALALYLCSDASAQITGTTVSIDGGWTAQ